MNSFLRVAQFLAVGFIAAAMVPFLSNQLAEKREREVREVAASRAESFARAAAETKDWALAGQAWSSALQNAPGNEAYRAALVAARTEQILDDGAALTARNVLRIQTELGIALSQAATPDVRLLLAFGRVLQFRGKTDEAMARFDEATKLDPKSALAFLLLGDAHLKAGKLEDAAKALETALALDDRQSLARFALGQVRVQQEKWDEATTLIEPAAKELPRNAAVHLALGKLQVRKKQWKDAVKSLERALALAPDLNAARAPLGEAYAADGQVEAAAGALTLAWERTGDVDAYRKLGRLYQNLGMVEKAVEIFNRIRAIDPADPEPHCQLGSASEAAGEVEVAKKAYARCIELSAAKPEAIEMAKRASERLQGLNVAGGGKKARTNR